MSAQIRCGAFLALSIGAGMIRWKILVGSRELPPAYYAEHGAKMLDFSLDALIGAIALIVGVAFYIAGAGGSIAKPGTAIVITATDVAGCAYISFLAFAAILAFQIPDQPGLASFSRDVISVGLPDILTSFALAYTVIKLT